MLNVLSKHVILLLLYYVYNNKRFSIKVVKRSTHKALVYRMKELVNLILWERTCHSKIHFKLNVLLFSAETIEFTGQFPMSKDLGFEL